MMLKILLLVSLLLVNSLSVEAKPNPDSIGYFRYGRDGYETGTSTRLTKSTTISPTESRLFWAERIDKITKGQKFINELFEAVDELRDSLIKKENERAKLRLIKDADMPRFEDPLDLHNVYEKYKLADVNFTDVLVKGLSSFDEVRLREDIMEQKGSVRMFVPSLEIVGNYSLKNFLKTFTGVFTIKLINVSYTDSFDLSQFVEYQRVVDSKPTLTYEHSENAYHDLGWVANLFKGAISDKLINNVLTTLLTKIHTKLDPIVITRMHSIINSYDKLRMVLNAQTRLNASIASMMAMFTHDTEVHLPLSNDTVAVEVGNDTTASIQNIILTGFDNSMLLDSTVMIEEGRYQIYVVMKHPNLSGRVQLEMMDKHENRRTVMTKVSMNYFTCSTKFKGNITDKNDFLMLDDVKVDAGEVEIIPKDVSERIRDEWKQITLKMYVKSYIEKQFVAVMKSYFEDMLRNRYAEVRSGY